MVLGKFLGALALLLLALLPTLVYVYAIDQLGNPQGNYDLGILAGSYLGLLFLATAYCAIGVFALHNVVFDIWVMFFFGVIGYFMKKLGFPLAPMILGVVLGKLAELNLARASGISDDLLLFISRPWSLFFLLMAVISVIFPFYQEAKKDTLFAKLYVPISMIVLSLPLFLMGSPVRMIIAAILLLAGGYFVYKRTTTLQVI